MKEMYTARWTGTGGIARNQCFTDKERAEKYVAFLNKQGAWWRRLFVHQWVLMTLTVVEGKSKQ
jgi:hypothetical protein